MRNIFFNPCCFFFGPHCAYWDPSFKHSPRSQFTNALKTNLIFSQGHTNHLLTGKFMVVLYHGGVPAARSGNSYTPVYTHEYTWSYFILNQSTGLSRSVLPTLTVALQSQAAVFSHHLLPGPFSLAWHWHRPFSLACSRAILTFCVLWLHSAYVNFVRLIETISSYACCGIWQSCHGLKIVWSSPCLVSWYTVNIIIAVEVASYNAIAK